MFNFKLSKRIGVFDMIGCNEWKIEKSHECTNIRQLQTIRTVCDVGTKATFTNFKAAGFLLDRVYILEFQLSIYFA